MKIYDYNGRKNICGDRLREARVVQRLRQEDLAAKIQTMGVNMERDSISRIEIGTRFVSDFELKVSAKALGVSVDWLLGKIGSDHELAAFIEKKIGEEGYSPAAVVGEIKRLGLTFKTEISEKTIYNYIDKGIFFGISRESLPEKGKRKRKYEKVKRKKSARAPQGESIERRDPEIDERKTFGHWEGDCVCGKKKTKEALFVLSERLTRQEIIMKIPDQTAASVVAALNKLERRYGKRFSKIFKSITFDNGSEFADCAGIEKSIYGKNRKRTKVYYCHPYSAFERGTNENINRMIRRFLPKGTDFRKVTAAYILRVETWINNYPREILGFASSNDLFAAHLAAA